MAGAITRAAFLFRKLLSGKPVTYAALEEEAGINRRTALRWVKEARYIFGDQLKEHSRENGEKGFWLDNGMIWMRRFQQQPPTSEEMAAVDAALESLLEHRMLPHHAQLTALRSRLHGVLQELERARQTGTDTDALTDAFGIGSRPGPCIPVSRTITESLRQAILERHEVRFRYQNEAGRISQKRAAPAGLVYGGAVRLVARLHGDDDLMQFRLDRMSEVEVLEEPYFLAEDALSNYLMQFFGSYAEKPVQVKWRFHPQAPEPWKWKFHSTQKITREPDGSTVVRFRAGGLDDLARHVIGWWDWIEVLRPKRLRRRVLEMKLAGLAPLLAEFTDQRTASRIGNLAAGLGANRVEAIE